MCFTTRGTGCNTAAQVSREERARTSDIERQIRGLYTQAPAEPVDAGTLAALLEAAAAEVGPDEVQALTDEQVAELCKQTLFS